MRLGQSSGTVVEDDVGEENREMEAREADHVGLCRTV